MNMPHAKSTEERAESKRILRLIMATLTTKEVKAIGRISPFLLINGFYTYVERFREWDSYMIRLESNGMYTLEFQRWAEKDIDRTYRKSGVRLEEIGATIAQALDYEAPYK